MPWEHTGSKIAARHRERLAVVYVRQSTRQQVVGHQESTRLQYALVDRAVALGWEACRVVLIDDDLGKSGSSAEHRVGFQRLVAEISLGHVGLVLGIEMSRLARSGADWYQLLELCALGGSLLADADGVYDPTEYNDRLLLGLKGTMSGGTRGRTLRVNSPSGWAGYFRYGNSAREFDKIRSYAVLRVALFVAKRHQRGRAWGFAQVYRSPDSLGLISLNGTVVAPRPNRSWRAPVEHRR